MRPSAFPWEHFHLTSHSIDFPALPYLFLYFFHQFFSTSSTNLLLNISQAGFQAISPEVTV
jgi:hypothetical protein